MIKPSKIFQLSSASITVSTIYKLLRKFTDEYGDIMKFRAGKNWLVVLSNPLFSEQLLRDADKYPARPTVGILDAYYKRKKLSPGLSSLYSVLMITSNPNPFLPIRQCMLNIFLKKSFQIGRVYAKLFLNFNILGKVNNGPILENLPTTKWCARQWYRHTYLLWHP